MDPHPTDGSGDGRPATLAIEGVTKFVCRHCGTTAYTERGGDRPITNCGACGSTDFVITAATGATVADAIARAAQEMPEQVEPRQPSIPGLTPIFDLAAALDAIEEAALDARLAERDYAQAHEIAKGKRKTADAANAKLRDLIAELTERRHDARYEGNTDDHEVAQAIQNTHVAAGETPDPPDDSGVNGTREQAGMPPTHTAPTPGVLRNPSDLSPGVGETR